MRLSIWSAAVEWYAAPEAKDLPQLGIFLWWNSFACFSSSNKALSKQLFLRTVIRNIFLKKFIIFFKMLINISYQLLEKLVYSKFSRHKGWELLLKMLACSSHAIELFTLWEISSFMHSARIPFQFPRFCDNKFYIRLIVKHLSLRFSPALVLFQSRLHKSIFTLELLKKPF